jgi:ribosomal protein S6--L-glutamate ligase
MKATVDTGSALVAVLSRQPDSYSVQRFSEAARERAIPLLMLDPHLIYLELSAGAPDAYCQEPRWRSQRLKLIPRLGSTATEFSVAALDMLERKGASTVNRAASLLLMRNKFTALATLAAAGIPVPDSAMLRAPCSIAPAVERLGGYPLVLKFIRGSQGVGVVYAPDESVVTSVLEALNLLQYDVLLQRFYPRAAQSDLRVFVLGGEPRWAIRRESTGGRFRSNFHRGGQAQVAKLDQATAVLAQRATAVFGLGMAGVDLIEGPDGWLVMEVNSSPGFEAIESVQDDDVAGAILEYAQGL